MTVAELKALLAGWPDDAPVVLPDYHAPMPCLGEDEYDDYAGTKTGTFSKADVTFDAHLNQVEVDRAW